METNRDVARGWVQKADEDLKAVDVTLESRLIGVACFHAQQAAEKMLKAYLIFMDHDFPFTHDLEPLVKIAAKLDSRFTRFLPSAKKLNPYAVNVRCESGFLPTIADARRSFSTARAIARFVLARMKPKAPRRPRRRTARRQHG